MTTYDRDWYDEVMVEEGSPAMLPLEQSPWQSTYEEIAKLLDAHEPVVDLGCGTGRFIELLQRRGHYGPITGVDWAGSALEEAQRYITVAGAPVELVEQDLNEWQPDPNRAGGTVYVCTEVLEHLDDDLGLVARVPPGHRLLFSVPNFDSESHVRVFRTVGSVWERYSQLLHIRRWVAIGSDRQGIHVVESRRRGDAW